MRAVLIPLAVLVVLVAARMVALNSEREAAEQAVSAADAPVGAPTARLAQPGAICASVAVDPVRPVGNVGLVGGLGSGLSDGSGPSGSVLMIVDEDFSWGSPVDDAEPVPSEAETWAAWEPPPGACTQPDPSILPVDDGQLTPSVASEKTGF